MLCRMTFTALAYVVRRNQIKSRDLPNPWKQPPTLLDDDDADLDVSIRGAGGSRTFLRRRPTR